MPWLDGSSPITSSTIVRVSGQNFSAQRGTMPPWLKPTTEIRRPARACMVRIALTTYSPATWTSLIAWCGSVTAHHGRCAAVNTNS